jgi:hypothetical protein
LNGENKSVSMLSLCSVRVLMWLQHPLVPTRENGARDLDEEWSYIDTWKEMEKLVDTGKVKAVSPHHRRRVPLLTPTRRSESATVPFHISRNCSSTPRLSPPRTNANATPSTPNSSWPTTASPRGESPGYERGVFTYIPIVSSSRPTPRWVRQVLL